MASLNDSAFHDLWGTGGVTPEPATKALDPKAFESQWLTEGAKETTPAEDGSLHKVGAGFGKGVMDVANTGAQGIGYLTNHVTKFLADRGIMTPEDVSTAQGRSDVLAKRVADENKNFETRYGDSYLAGGGRIGGQLLASAPLLATGEGAVGAGVNALTRYSPEFARAAATLGGNALTRLGVIAPAQGALAGGTIAGATSSSSNEPVPQQMAEGAGVGAALGPVGPMVAGAGRYLGSAAKAIVEPFTEAGQNRLANATVQKFAGNPLTVNPHEIVPGSTPTLAEATGDANVATIQRSARDLNPQPFTALEAKNSQARTDLLDKHAGTPQDVEAAKASLDAQAGHAVATLFKPGQVVDTAPVVSEIDGILKGAGGKRDAVQTVLNNVRSKLVNKDGSLESNPEVVYNSVRKQIGDLLDKKADSSAGQQAQRELIQVRDALDERMTKAVPGFDNYLKDYSSAAKPIDAAKYLQGLNLKDATGNITLAKVQTALNGISKQRQAGGVNPAKSLTDDHIQALTDIRDDLLRKANVEKGKSIGSPTVQNIATQNMLGGIMGNRLSGMVGNINPALVGSGIGGGLGAALAGGYGASAGSALGYAAGHLAGGALAGKNAAVQHQLENILLNPHKFSSVMQGGQNLPVNRLGVVAPAGVAGYRSMSPPPLDKSR